MKKCASEQRDENLRFDWKLAGPKSGNWGVMPVCEKTHEGPRSPQISGDLYTVVAKGCEYRLPKSTFIGKDDLELRWFRSNLDGDQDVTMSLLATRGFRMGEVFSGFGQTDIRSPSAVTEMTTYPKRHS